MYKQITCVSQKRNTSVSDQACQALGCSLHLLSVSVLSSPEPVEVGAVLKVHFTHEETGALRVRCSPGLYSQKRMELNDSLVYSAVELFHPLWAAQDHRSFTREVWPLQNLLFEMVGPISR